MQSRMFGRPYDARVTCLVVVCAILSLAGTTDFFESEPNNSKSEADVAIVFDGGTSTLNGFTTSETDVDYWRIATSLEIGGGRARYTLLIRSDSGEHRLTLRGQSQVNGVIDINSDVAVQEAAALGGGRTGLVFYGDPQAYVTFKVEPLTSTAGAYRLDLRWEQFAAQDLGTFNPGQIEVSTLNQGHSTDTDLFVQADFSSTMFGSNDDSVNPPAEQSHLVRDFTAGPYALMLSDSNLAAGGASPADDGDRNQPVIDYSGAVAAQNPSSAPIDLSFTITDSSGTVAVEAERNSPFEVRWFGFRLGNSWPGSGACCFPDGRCGEIYSPESCVANGGVFLGENSFCAVNTCGGSCCLPTNVCLYSNRSNCESRGGTFTPGVFCGSSTDCVPASTSIGACCLGTAGCVEFTPQTCAYVHGVYAGDGTQCTTRHVYTSTPNVAIPDAAAEPGTVEDTISVTDVMDIHDIEVGLMIEHSWQGQLEARLRGPNGVEVTLIDRAGPAGVGFLENDLGNPLSGEFMLFDDAGPRRYAINYGLPVPQNQPTGRWWPAQRFAPYFGTSSQGDWQLTVKDHTPGHVGRLVSWQLRLGGPPTRACCAGQPRGDSNCDTRMNNFDIECFVVAVSDGSDSWSGVCGQSGCSFVCVNDINGDNRVNSFDIDAFVDCLANGCE